MVISTQAQIYLVAGILGIVCLILVFVVGVLFLALDGLKKRLHRIEKESLDKSTPNRVINVTSGQQNFAFTEPAIKPNEELARRGYVMSAGQLMTPRLQR